MGNAQRGPQHDAAPLHEMLLSGEWLCADETDGARPALALSVSAAGGRLRGNGRVSMPGERRRSRYSYQVEIEGRMGSGGVQLLLASRFSKAQLSARLCTAADGALRLEGQLAGFGHAAQPLTLRRA